MCRICSLEWLERPWLSTLGQRRGTRYFRALRRTTLASYRAASGEKTAWPSRGLHLGTLQRSFPLQGLFSTAHIFFFSGKSGNIEIRTVNWSTCSGSQTCEENNSLHLFNLNILSERLKGIWSCLLTFVTASAIWLEFWIWNRTKNLFNF